MTRPGPTQCIAILFGLTLAVSACADDGGSGDDGDTDGSEDDAASTGDGDGDGDGASDGNGDGGTPNADCPPGTTLLASGVDGVYIEVEAVSPGPDWTQASDVPDYQGDGYFQWKDEKVNAPKDDDTGFMTYCFEVGTSGTYKLGIRGRRDRDTNFCKDAPNDACNDVFVRFNDDGWTKKMIKPDWGEWSWDENWDPQNGSPFPTEVQLEAGVHSLGIAGRSHGTKIDAIRIYELDSEPPSS